MPACNGEGSGAAGTKSFKAILDDSVKIGIVSLPCELAVLSDLDMINVPGEDVDESEFYIRYAPNLCRMFPAK